jgi:hypothetical protein
MVTDFTITLVNDVIAGKAPDEQSIHGGTRILLSREFTKSNWFKFIMMHSLQLNSH